MKMYVGIIHHFICSLLFQVVLGTDYCSMCSTPGIHTMCVYEANLAEKCIPKKANERGVWYVPKPLTADNIDAIIDLHNRVRETVAEGHMAMAMAADMMMVKWDSELADIAQRWANQCTNEVDSCRDVSRFPVSQNVGEKYSFEADEHQLYEIIRSWGAELQQFDQRVILKYEPSKAYSNVANMIWAKTSYVGCGRLAYVDNREFLEKYGELIVCNYGPGGSVYGQPVYQIGTPCSKCPEGFTCVMGGLCADDEQLGKVMELISSMGRNRLKAKVEIIFLSMVYLLF